MTDRVVLFVDYQNVYSSARRVFHDNRGPGRLGQIWPLAVGDLLCTRTQPSGDWNRFVCTEASRLQPRAAPATPPPAGKSQLGATRLTLRCSRIRCKDFLAALCERSGLTSIWRQIS